MDNSLTEKQTKMLIEAAMKGHPDAQYPIGTRIVKHHSEEGDLHEIGTAGTVVGNLVAPAELEKEYGGPIPQMFLVHFDGDVETDLHMIMNDKITDLESWDSKK